MGRGVFESSVDRPVRIRRSRVINRTEVLRIGVLDALDEAGPAAGVRNVLVLREIEHVDASAIHWVCLGCECRCEIYVSFGVVSA